MPDFDPADPMFPYTVTVVLCVGLFFLTVAASLIFRRMERRDQERWELHLKELKNLNNNYGRKP